MFTSVTTNRGNTKKSLNKMTPVTVIRLRESSSQGFHRFCRPFSDSGIYQAALLYKSLCTAFPQSSPHHIKPSSLCNTVEHGSAFQRSLAEFAAAAANKVMIIFDGGVYFGKNTAQFESVEIARPTQGQFMHGSNYSLWAEKPVRFFSTVSTVFPLQYRGRRFFL